ncbi:DUF262 domain-containing protein [Bradyrhizobium sp. 31Argb]|uniref:DUF262 domain-containing protein n=1 Tax=Bradyrhizobium sp. 31Argb TaxID=3141247 RepID=UPI003747FBA0
MTAIDAKARNVRELLGGKKYTIDYFQREYRWRTKEIGELISDLTVRFLAKWQPSHGRAEVAKYPSYFLGPIIVSGEGGGTSVIDGQQRLTSLSILLIWLHHGLTLEEDRKQIADLIFTRQYGANSYNLDVPERTAAIDALYRQEPYNRDGAPESVRNILDRYDDIDEAMPEEIKGPARAMFADWLIEQVYLVEIKSPSDDDGYAIFETMNDRGLPLSPTDMLKSHLLANAGSESVKVKLNALWKGRIDQLLKIDKEEDADAIKSWLRAKFADKIRERQAGAQPEDFDRIGTEFHRWVRDNGARLGLTDQSKFARFVERNFDFYTGWYLKLREAALTLTVGREAIYCNALANFTMQYPLMLAPIQTGDSDDVAWRKAMVVASFVDILIARRQWNGKSIDYNTMQYAMFLAMKEIRDCSAPEMADLLKKRLDADAPPFSYNTRFGLWSANKKTVRRFLARLTFWIDQKVGVSSSLVAYLTSTGAQGYDIEHVIPDQHAPYVDMFPAEEDFQEYRNRLGDLLLLPRSFNRSYGDLPYPEKREHYLQQNVLAQTFHEKAYERNPGLRRLIEEWGIPFRPYDELKKIDLEQRQAVVTRLAEEVWNAARLTDAANPPN